MVYRLYGRPTLATAWLLVLLCIVTVSLSLWSIFNFDPECLTRPIEPNSGQNKIEEARKFLLSFRLPCSSFPFLLSRLLFSFLSFSFSFFHSPWKQILLNLARGPRGALLQGLGLSSQAESEAQPPPPEINFGAIWSLWCLKIWHQFY